MSLEDWREERIRRFDADREIASIEDGLGARDPAAIDAALAYLERDPRGFRTGYAKQRLLARLHSRHLDDAARTRLVALVLRAAEHGFHGTRREYGHLVRKFATNDLRRRLRRLVCSTDDEVAWRAVWLLTQVRHPGLTTEVNARARALIRARAARADSRPYFSERRAAERFWSAEWEAELRELARSERDVGARRLLDDARQRVRVREWRASKRRDSAARSADAPSEDEA